MLMWWGGDPNPKRCAGTYVPLTPTGGVRGPAFPPPSPRHTNKKRIDSVFLTN